MQQVSSGQGLIAIDSGDQLALAPAFSSDVSGNAQVALIDLSAITLASSAPKTWWHAPILIARTLWHGAFARAQAAPNPIKSLISLPGSDFAVAAVFDSIHARMLVEGSNTSTGAVTVYQLDLAGNIVNTIAATGLSQRGAFNFGGILFAPIHDLAVVGGSSQVGLLDTSKSPPVWDQSTVTATNCTDSLSLNFNTQVLFIACDGTNQFLDASTFGAPLPITPFQSNFGTTDGNAFDSTTNIIGVDPEFQDVTRVFNFNNLDTSASPATAPEVDVPGLGTTSIVGEGPGGQASANTKTHQLFILDEFGENFRLIQLPKSTVDGALNNNGQPGSGTTADAASAYTIAAGVLPMVTDGNGNMSHLFAVGDPNSATIDQSDNRAFLLATDDTTPTCQLWLVILELNNPPNGACVNCAQQWKPANSTTLVTTASTFCG